jgi:hypothetical protein
MAYKTVIPQLLKREMRRGRVQPPALFSPLFSYMLYIMGLFFLYSSVSALSAHDFAIGISALGPMFALLVMGFGLSRSKR